MAPVFKKIKGDGILKLKKEPSSKELRTLLTTPSEYLDENGPGYYRVIFSPHHHFNARLGHVALGKAVVSSSTEYGSIVGSYEGEKDGKKFVVNAFGRRIEINYRLLQSLARFENPIEGPLENLIQQGSS